MKMTSKGVFVLMTVCFLASCSGNGNNFGEKVKQVSIHRVDSMPDMPETYKGIWPVSRQTAAGLEAKSPKV